LGCEPPIKRSGHATAMIGNTIIIHGGLSGEENTVIVDKDKKDP
jgi:hypothetical protein